MKNQNIRQFQKKYATDLSHTIRYVAGAEVAPY
jgi:hypothetical protein